MRILILKKWSNFSERLLIIKEKFELRDSIELNYGIQNLVKPIKNQSLVLNKPSSSIVVEEALMSNNHMWLQMLLTCFYAKNAR